MACHNQGLARSLGVQTSLGDSRTFGIWQNPSLGQMIKASKFWRSLKSRVAIRDFRSLPIASSLRPDNAIRANRVVLRLLLCTNAPFSHEGMKVLHESIRRAFNARVQNLGCIERLHHTKKARFTKLLPIQTVILSNDIA